MRTVRVRIAVAVDPTGNWNSCGFASEVARDRKEMMNLASEAVEAGEAHYWVEAELMVPEESTVQCSVVSAEP